jgi:ketosteroid isomerase-like protein
MPSAKNATTVLKDVLDAFNAHDLDAIMSFFAEDCVLEMPRGPAPGGRRLVGKRDVREGLRSRLDGIPDVHYGDDRHWACGDRGVSEWTLRGTWRTGEPIEVRGCDLFELADGKIRRKDSFWKIVE